MALCPCGSTRDYEACCSPFIEGKAFPPTAQALMRARYSAHSMGVFDYLQTSTHPKARNEVDWEELKKWSSAVTWESLEVLETENGQEGDEHGVVSFEAVFSYEGRSEVHREHSLFQRNDEGHWQYVDGEMDRPEPVRRESPKIGRNAPCPCGSGKKYKKCCGAA